MNDLQKQNANSPYARVFLALAFLIPFVWICVLRPLAMDGGESAGDGDDSEWKMENGRGKMNRALRI